MQDDTDTDGDDHSGDRQFVTALARGLEILSCFGPEDRFLSNHLIAERTGLARPTVSRLTHTLMKTGHLLRDAASGEYRLTPRVLQLGFSAIAAVNVGDRCGEVLESLCTGPNAYITAALAEGSHNRAVYLAVRRSKQSVSLSLNIGARLPLFYSGIGRAMLAVMPAAAREQALQAAIREFPDQRQRMEQSLEKGLRDYRTYGYCTGFGDWRPEINGIAAPVRSLDGTSVYGVNVGGPSFLVTPQELHADYGQRLLDAVRELGGP